MANRHIPVDLLHQVLQQVAEVAVENGTLSVQRIDNSVVHGFWLKKDELLQGDAAFVSTLGDCYRYSDQPIAVKNDALGVIPRHLQPFQPSPDERFGLALASVAWLNQRQEPISQKRNLLINQLLDILKELRR